MTADFTESGNFTRRLDHSLSNDASINSGDGTVRIELHPLITSGSNHHDDEEITHDQEQYYSATSPDHHHQNSSSGGHGHYGPAGTATDKQVAINVFISFVGAGMLGMPYAFSQAGLFLGPIALGLASATNTYAMLLIVQIRKELERQQANGMIAVPSPLVGYGDVGRVVMGPFGEKLVNGCLVISQVGFGTAYIIFIAANLKNIANIHPAVSCFSCIPILALLVQIQDMKKLSPVSLIADVANISGLCAVFFQDYQVYQANKMEYDGDGGIIGGEGETLKAFDFSKLLYVVGVSIYALEGVGLVLPLESSYIKRDDFPQLLSKCIFGITSLMILFGCAGYVAFGSETEAPITLNLVGEWATIVKLFLCVALYLTFPMMMFPVNEVMEDFFLSKNGPRPNRFFRTSVVCFSALIAYSIPDFGKFLSLVGSSICTILGFILPGYLHLKVFHTHKHNHVSDADGGGCGSVRRLMTWELCFDYFLIIFGIAFGIMGTYDSFVGLMEDLQSDDGPSSSSHSGHHLMRFV